MVGSINAMMVTFKGRTWECSWNQRCSYWQAVSNGKTLTAWHLNALTVFIECAS